MRERDGFKEVEDLTVSSRKRRNELDEKESSVKPERIDKADFYADKKRGDYITDNRKETPNVETEPNQ